MEIFLSFCTMEGTGRAHPGLMTIIERDKMKFFMAGLDTETKASVKIEWPSGAVQELGEVAADQQLHVQEPT